MKRAIKPNIGTTADIASGTLLKAICQPPCANVVTHIKNILALQTNKKKILLYNKVPQKIACWCTSLLNPFVINPIMKASIPTAINPIDQVLILPDASNCSLLDTILIIFDCSVFRLNYFAVSVAAVAAVSDAADEPAASCFDLIY